MKNIIIVILITFFMFTGCLDSNKEISTNLKTNVNEVESKIYELEEENKIKLEEINNLKTKIDKYEKQILNYKNEIDNLQENISILKSSENNPNNKISHENPFNKNDINLLDTVCTLTLIDKETAKYSDKEIISLLYFKGAIKVSGTFENVGEAQTDFSSYKIKFYPDEKSSYSLPKDKEDDRILWFILNDYNEIKEYFGEPGNSGKATIIIDNYTIDFRPIETANTADLVYVIDVELFK